MRVTQFGTGTESFGKACFHVHNHFHTLLGNSLIKAGQLIHFLYMSTEGITDSGSRRISSQIVIAFAHTQAALVKLHGVLVTVHFVSSHIKAEVSTDALFAQIGEQSINSFFIFQGSNLFQVGFDRSNTFLVQLHAVHNNLVEVAYLLRYTTCFMLSGSQFFNQTLYLLTVILGKFCKRTVL